MSWSNNDKNRQNYEIILKLKIYDYGTFNFYN